MVGRISTRFDSGHGSVTAGLAQKIRSYRTFVCAISYDGIPTAGMQKIKEEPMGTWSHESFGNDNACDWISELQGTNDLTFIAATLEAVIAKGDAYVEAPAAEEAIAAAETISRLQGNFGTRDAYSQGLDEWVGRVKLVPPRALALKTHQVLDRILTEPSELLELWQEGNGADAWIKAVSDLRSRVRI
jgi:hypothetical protein